MKQRHRSFISTFYRQVKPIGFNLLEHSHEMIIGANKLLVRLDDVPLLVPESLSVTYDMNKACEGMAKAPINRLGKLAYQSGAICSFFYEAYCHMPTPFIHSREEREKLADEGTAVSKNW